jgi:Domain of unknown function (DUF4388)
MVELKGSLGGIGLLAIVQLIGELHHSGTLRLARGNASSSLVFDGGHLVAAESGDKHGVQAVVASATELADAEFTFLEGTPPVEHTLDLGPTELRKLLARISSGEVIENEQSLAAVAPVEPAVEAVCPLLGFADDRDRHYSRPTALHRCYASGAPSLVTPQEQRELCLPGRFPACPRYRNTERASPVAAAVNEPPRLVTRAEPPTSTSPTVPPGVAARMAAASQLRVAPANGHQAGAVLIPSAEPVESPPPKRISRLSRGVVLIGAAVAVLVVAGALAFVAPRLMPRTAPVATSAVVPVATATGVAAPATAPPTVVAAGAQVTAPPTSLPTPQSTPIAVVRQPTQAVVSNSNPAKVLLDVRFAAGPTDGWLDNPPFGAWSDGAYRLQAKQAANFVALGVPMDRVLSDVVVSGTFRKTGGPPGGGYGLIVRDQGPPPRDGLNQDGNFYVLETGDLGDYGVWRRDGDHWVDLIPWMRSPSVRPGGSPNNLTVRAIGNRLTFEVNGAQLASVQDDTLMAGGVGVFVGGDYNEVALDRFTIQLPD